MAGQAVQTGIENSRNKEGTERVMNTYLLALVIELTLRKTFFVSDMKA